MKGLGKRILVMAAVTAVCVWAAGKSGYAVKPYRLDETELAQQVLEREGAEITKRSFVEKYLEVCREKLPPLQEAQPGHWVRCWNREGMV